MKDLIEELRQRQAASLELGGAKRVERQHNQGKLTARERVDLLFDPGTFEELGQLATHVHTPVTTIPDKLTPADGVITGLAKLKAARRPSLPRILRFLAAPSGSIISTKRTASSNWPTGINCRLSGYLMGPARARMNSSAKAWHRCIILCRWRSCPASRRKLPVLWGQPRATVRYWRQ